MIDKCATSWVNIIIHNIETMIITAEDWPGKYWYSEGRPRLPYKYFAVFKTSLLIFFAEINFMRFCHIENVFFTLKMYVELRPV